jgi:hypothetical protein
MKSPLIGGMESFIITFLTPHTGSDPIPRGFRYVFPGYFMQEMTRTARPADNSKTGENRRRGVMGLPLY